MSHQDTEADGTLEPDIFGVTAVESWQVGTYLFNAVGNYKVPGYLAYMEGCGLCFFSLESDLLPLLSS